MLQVFNGSDLFYYTGVCQFSTPKQIITHTPAHAFEVTSTTGLTTNSPKLRATSNTLLYLKTIF